MTASSASALWSLTAADLVVAGPLPAIVAVAITREGGGIGLQLVAGHGRDHDLLAFIERAQAFATLRPAPLAKPDETHGHALAAV